MACYILLSLSLVCIIACALGNIKYTSTLFAWLRRKCHVKRSDSAEGVSPAKAGSKAIVRPSVMMLLAFVPSLSLFILVQIDPFLIVSTYLRIMIKILAAWPRPMQAYVVMIAPFVASNAYLVALFRILSMYMKRRSSTVLWIVITVGFCLSAVLYAKALCCGIGSVMAA